MKTLLLTKEEVGRLISMKDVIGTVEEAYKAFSSGQVVQPDYIEIHLSEPRGEIDFKAGYCKTNEIISMKASSGGFSITRRRMVCPTAWELFCCSMPGAAH